MNETDSTEPSKLKPVEPKPEPPQIGIDAFMKLDLRVATIVEASAHPDADKLLVLKVDAGEAQPRQVVAGIKHAYAPEQLNGKQIVIVANLKPVRLRGVESQGMLLAASDDSGLSLVTLEQPRRPGSQVR